MRNTRLTRFEDFIVLRWRCERRFGDSDGGDHGDGTASIEVEEESSKGNL